jgi:DNA-binding HxlR family transcriptional regulator
MTNATFFKAIQLTPQGRLILDHMTTAGSISAREAMSDYGITSAVLTRRICDMEAKGISIARDQRRHPVTGRNYTRYSLVAPAASQLEPVVGARVRLTKSQDHISVEGSEGTIVEIEDGADTIYPFQVAVDADPNKHVPWPLGRHEFEVIG